VPDYEFRPEWRVIESCKIANMQAVLGRVIVSKSLILFGVQISARLGQAREMVALCNAIFFNFTKEYFF
jgi:hypothetical protein